MAYRMLHSRLIHAYLLLAATAIVLLTDPQSVHAQITGQAIVGHPFGVGHLQVRLDKRQRPQPLGWEGLGLSEKNGRVLYPAIDRRTLSPLVKELLGQLPLRGGPVRDLAGGLLRGLVLEPPQKVEVFFLFTGDAPLELTVQYREQATGQLIPQNDPPLHDMLLRRWWDEYTSRPGALTKKADYPPLVENYLQAMLSSRLQLPLPEQESNSLQDRLEQQFGLAIGTESAQIAMERDEMLGKLPTSEAADQPLPKAFDVPPLELPEVDKDVKVDTLASRVPEECFYVRFGSFSHFLWFQDMLATWGGDLQNLLALRGLDHRIRQRMENQLVLRSTALAKLLGDTVVADVAIIGTDLYLEDGGAYGLLFLAKNSTLLAGDLNGQRAERLQKKDGVTEEKVKIGGRDVSYLSTPDGSVRSYHVSDGNYHFVTTSKTLVQRFLETGDGKRALGSSAEFRYARTVLPQSRDDTVFVYISDAFFRNLVSPHYQIELARRIRSLADIELVRLAMLASAAEVKNDTTIESLSNNGFLPPKFGRRPDGSQTVLKDGKVFDTRRGFAGRFVPIPDVEVSSVTPSEVSDYEQLADRYHTKWKRLDPIIAGLKRHELPDRRERITIDARLTPVAKENYERLQQYVGPADETQLAPIEGDLIAFELVRPNARVFGGLRDLGLPDDSGAGTLLSVGTLRDIVVGYLGTTGSSPLLGVLELGMSPPDAQGMSGTPAGLWRRQYGPMAVYSFQPDLLMSVTPQLRFEPAKTAAQLRIRVADLTQSGVPPLLNRLGYVRTRETTLGNLRLLHQISQQLRVPGSDCKATAESLLDAKLICPLGGQYVYRSPEGAPGCWTSTFFESEASTQASVPPGFVTPPLNWFRGLLLDAQLEPSTLSVHADVEMQLPKK